MNEGLRVRDAPGKGTDERRGLALTVGRHQLAGSPNQRERRSSRSC